MDISVKDLRYRTKHVLHSLRRGTHTTITYRGRPVARLVPLTTHDTNVFHPIGFGMWKDHAELKDVHAWLDDQRGPRYGR